MATSDASWSSSFRKIGDLERSDHWHLTEADNCFFLGEYTSRGGYSHSQSNQLIHNLKKSPLTRGTAQWRHKERAIGDIARVMKAGIKPESIQSSTFIPIPTSKSVDHPEYDDRLMQIARLIAPGGDVRDLIYTVATRNALHVDGGRRDLDALRQSLAINQTALAPPPQHIFLLDDVITTGCSFRVCSDLLRETFPNIGIVGLFVARRIIPSAVADFDILD
jgi:hypothetical protein